MKDDKQYQLAKQYVDQQLDTMKQFGSAPKDISPAEYESLVDNVAETLKSNKPTPKQLV